MHSASPRTFRPSVPLGLCLAALLSLSLVTFPGSAHAAEVAASMGTAQRTKAKPKVGFGIVPATAKDLDVRSLFSFGLSPGSVAYDHVAVVNYSPKALNLDVYATDALNSAEGGYALRAATDKPSDLGAWVVVGEKSRRRTVSVPGRRKDGSPGRVILPVAISVPANATPGDHAAGIVASLITLGKNPTGQNVRLEQRVAGRIYVRVSGKLQPDLAVTALKATYIKGDRPFASGSVRVDYTITNGGNLRMGFNPSVEVAGPFGVGRRSAAGSRVAELLPGSSQRIRTTVSGIWPMGYDNVTVVAAPVAAIAAAAPPVEPARETIRIWVITWELMLELLLLSALLGYLIVRHMSRRRQARASVTEPAAGRGLPSARPAVPASRADR
jgi:hypothetical protein